MTATYLTVILFVLFLILGVPVSVSLIAGLVIAVWAMDVYPLLSVATLFYNSLDSYLLVAIPLFMLAGITMSYGGVAKRIFDFSEALLGFLPGSLGSVNVMASMIFGGMSGSSVADVAGLGTLEIKEMTRRNYPLKYATAITVASSTMAVIIPPSILLIIYATIANESVGAALAAGLVPGILITVAIIGVNTVLALRSHWGGGGSRLSKSVESRCRRNPGSSGAGHHPGRDILWNFHSHRSFGHCISLQRDYWCLLLSGT